MLWEVGIDLGNNNMDYWCLCPNLFDEGVLGAESDDYLSIRIVKLVDHFACCIDRVTWHDDAPYLQNGIICEQKLWAVGQIDGYPVTLFDTQGL